MWSALAIVGTLNVSQASGPDVDVTTTVMAAAAQTPMAKVVEDRANKIIETYSHIPKENLGYVAAAGAAVINKEISTFQIKNNNFTVGNFKARIDARYKIIDQESNVSLSFVREF